MEGQIQGFSLTALEVQKLTNKKFTIIGVPFYREVESLQNSKETIKKLIVTIELEENNVQTEWYANKTSQSEIMNSKGRELKNWVGYQGEFVIKHQLIGKEEKPVIYLK